MRARLRVLDTRGQVQRGLLPFVTDSLEFSTTVDGDGDIVFEALMSDIDALSAWTCTVLVELSVDGTTWVEGPAYGMRHQYTHRGGSRRFKLSGRELLNVWASETLVLPEQVRGHIYRTAGKERHIGWMASAYDHAADPREPWALAVDTGRTAKPKNWPAGSGAKWVTARNFTAVTEAKFFRAWLTVPGTGRQRVRFYLAADQESKLYVAGELLLEGSWDEGDWKNDYARRTMSIYPGTYAVGIFNESQVSKGGDGIDPTLFAAALLDDQGRISQWLLRSDDAYFRACRRDDVPGSPASVPPGPTPGQVVRYLRQEAADRNVSGWPAVTADFTDTADSYGQAWAPVTERSVRIGETYWDLLQGLAEVEECDTWLQYVGGVLKLRCAARRGRPLGFDFTETQLWRAGTQGTPALGTWAMADTDSGWYSRQRSGMVRRETMLTLGQAPGRYTAERMIDSALRDGWRWDATGSLNPPRSGWVPWVDFNLGDWGRLRYRAIDHAVCVQSLAASAGEGGLMVEVGFTEHPPDGWIGGDPALLAGPMDGGLPNPEKPDTRVWGEH